MATLDSSVTEIVTEDFRAAAVLERFGIDFCCGGRRTLREACRDKRLDALDVLIEVGAACDRTDPNTPRFTDWEPDTLVAYIVGHHHSYVRRTLPVILAHTRKVAASHGEANPALREIALLFEEVASEMTSHMEKEELVLFPYISKVALARRTGGPTPTACFDSVDGPIQMMEHEHERAGEAMARIRDLAGDYALPANACTTYVVSFRELEEFEKDLHVHVHLENNLLFPKLRAMAH